jgi:hypothetical protein
MAFGSKPSQTIADCKLKRVYPRLPLRVHSAAPKGLAETDWGYPFPQEPTAGDAVCGSDRVRIRLESEVISEAWRRLESTARRHRWSVEDFFLGTLEEAS